MILDDALCLCWASHHRVEDLRPQNRNTSNHRHHDNQRFPGAQTATGWLDPTVDRCCHCEWQPGFFSVSFWNFNHSCSLLFSFLPFLLPIWKMPASRITAFLAKNKLSVFTSISVSCFSLNFFLFRAPLTEMTRLLLIVLRCTQLNLSFRFSF